MHLYCGTSGFSFKEWKGRFYPEKLPAAEMLEFYAGRLPTVEINNTFYRIPKREVIEGWCGQVPETFRFAVKASRRITHLARLANCEESAGYFFRAIETFGERLGAVLVQLPPNFKIDLARLEAFLDLVPSNVPTAFEFRHGSWHDDTVLELLARHGAAWVTNDDEGKAPPDLPATTSWTYLRLRAPEYSARRLREWRKRLEHFERAFVFFKHEDEAAGPALAARMQNL